MFDLISSVYSEIVDQFLNPQKRLFFGYLLLALTIAVTWMIFFTGKNVKESIQTVFDPSVWFAKSARADYKLFFINRFVFFFLNPVLVSQLAVAYFIYELLYLQSIVPLQYWSSTPKSVIVVAFTTTFFIIDDFSRFLLHRQMHKWQFLWAFHKVHHSAEVLTPLTIFRTHPIEGILFGLRAALVQGFCLSIFLFVFGNGVDLVTVFGVNIAVVLFHATGSNLRHSNISIRYWRVLEYIFISPAQHQIHHSIDQKHFNRNYGVVLAIWDWLFGSLHHSESDKLRYGLGQNKGSDNNSLYSLYVEPLTTCSNIFVNYFKGIKQVLGKKIGLKDLGRSFCVFLLITAFSFDSSIVESNEINIYSHRQPFLIKPFLDRFTEKTGIETNVLYASKGLAQRLALEGESSPADVVLTVDIARLYVYADKDLLAPVESKILEKSIPENLRSENNTWFGFSKRSRIMAISKRFSEGESIERIEDLAKEKFKGKVCSRPGSHEYNRGLLASLIAANGDESARLWAAGLVENLARRPQGNDRAQVKAIHQGECDIAILNHYYYGKLLTSNNPEHRKWAESIDVKFPNQGESDRGSHINISGGGIAKYSKNKENALTFLEFLVSEEAQNLYARINFEYPVLEGIALPEALLLWGKFRADNIPIERIAELSPTAQKIIDEVGW